MPISVTAQSRIRSTPPGAGHAKFPLHHALAAVPRALEQGQQRLGAAGELGDPPAECLIGPEPEQGLRGRIQVSDLQVAIQQKDAGDQGIQEFACPRYAGPAVELSGQTIAPRRRKQNRGLGSAFVLRRQQLGTHHVERHGLGAFRFARLVLDRGARIV